MPGTLVDRSEIAGCRESRAAYSPGNAESRAVSRTPSRYDNLETAKLVKRPRRYMKGQHAIGRFCITEYSLSRKFCRIVIVHVANEMRVIDIFSPFPLCMSSSEQFGGKRKTKKCCVSCLKTTASSFCMNAVRTDLTVSVIVSCLGKSGQSEHVCKDHLADTASRMCM